MTQVLDAPLTRDAWIEQNPLRAYRKEKGWSQFTMATFLDCSPSAIANYEMGRQSPSRRVLERFAKRSFQIVSKVSEAYDHWRAQEPLEWEA